MVGAGLTFSVGSVGGWFEIWRVKLISTQVVDEVELEVELGNKSYDKSSEKGFKCIGTFSKRCE